MNDTALAESERKMIDDYLDQVERHLLDAGAPRGERQTIIEDLEGQIFEMIAERSRVLSDEALGEEDQGITVIREPVSEEVVREILDSLDAPERYAGAFGGAERPTESPHYPRWTIWGLVAGVAPAVLYLLMLASAAAGLFGLTSVLMWAFTASLVVAPVASVWCGIMALRAIKQSPERFLGRELATICCLAYPVLLVNLVVGALIMATLPYSIYVLLAAAFAALNVWLVVRFRKLVHWAMTIESVRVRRVHNRNGNGALQLN